MDFIEGLTNLSSVIAKRKDIIETEEATKNAFVMPFINLLGYNVFDPTEVVPEFTADVGTKQGEKVDYAIFKDDEVIMLIECKKYGTDLSDAHTTQLYRYFSVVHARIAVLTDGVIYRFYTDLEESNIMDSKP
ncbi:MAG: type I restriction enzyme HsdR N-terminal domain-containing protein, partial [Candidatus Poribacteria bacterium]|nr:type I restriction enzyme HsdR N-terminal domain-containing protein [Candidatus Poribacteria bacterium]